MVLITIANHDHQQEKRASVFKGNAGPNEHALGDAVVFHWLYAASGLGKRKREDKIELWKSFPGKERESML